MRERKGDYPDWFRELLEEPNQHWDFHAVEKGEFPARVEDYDGYVITGGPASAFEDLPWMHQLLDFVRKAHAAQRRILGVCLGAQVLAQALGGEVRRNPRGWELGVIPIGLTPTGASHPIMSQGPRPLNLLQLHQDIITAAPAGAVILASSANTPVEVFTLGKTVLAIQGHPELDKDAVLELVDRRNQQGLIPDGQAQSARESLSLEVHQDFMRQWMRGFLKHGLNSGVAHPPPPKSASA